MRCAYQAYICATTENCHCCLMRYTYQAYTIALP